MSHYRAGCHCRVNIGAFVLALPIMIFVIAVIQVMIHLGIPQLDKFFGVTDKVLIVELGPVVVEIHGDPLKKSERETRNIIANTVQHFGGVRIPLGEYEGTPKLFRGAVWYTCEIFPVNKQMKAEQLRLKSVCGRLGDSGAYEVFESNEPEAVARFIRDYKDRK